MKTILIQLFILSSLISFSQNTFLNIYNDSTLSGELTLLESGNIIIPIHTSSNTISFPVLYKFNKNGEILITKNITNSLGLWSSISKLQICDDGNLMDYGTKYTGDSTIYDLWVLKMDTSFNIINEHLYHTGLNYINQINNIIDSFGNVILFCNSAEPYPLNQNFIFRLNQEGDSLYAKIYNNYNGQWALDILQKKDNTGYYLFSHWPQLSSGLGNEIIEVNNDFEIVKVTGQTGNLSNNTAMWFNDTSFIICGQKTNPQSDTIYKLGVSIVDTSGTLSNEFYWGRPDTVYQLTNYRGMDIKNDYIYFAGTYNFSMFPNINTWILINKLDSNLNLKWQKFIGGNNYYILKSIIITEDGSCIISGNYADLQDPYDFYLSFFLAKVGPNGEFLTNEELPQDIMEVKLYPNPGNNYFMIDVKLPSANSKLQLYNIQGKLCGNYNLTNGSNRINTTILKSGTYILNIIDNNKSDSHRVVFSTKWMKN